MGFHPVQKKINWESTNVGFAHLGLLLDFLIRVHKVQVDPFQVQTSGFRVSVSNMENAKTFDVAGPVFSKQEVGVFCLNGAESFDIFWLEYMFRLPGSFLECFFGSLWKPSLRLFAHKKLGKISPSLTKERL